MDAMNTTRAANVTRVYTRIVIDGAKDGLPVIERDYFDYIGPITQCGKSSGGGGSYEISAEEKAILKTLNDNMNFMTSLYKENQLPYDLMVSQGNMELYPDYFSYNKSQLGDAQADLALNRTVKDQMAQKQLGDIQKQGALSDLEFGSAVNRTMTYDNLEQKVAGERLGMLTADIPGAMGKATADVNQAYGNQREALARDQARLGVKPSSGMASEQSRLTGLDFAKANAFGRQSARDAETTRVENANLARTQANWGKDTALLAGGRQSMVSAKDYSAMLNGGYGMMAGYQPNTGTPAGTDFGAQMNATSNSAASGPQGVYVPGSSNNFAGQALGAAATLGSAWMMSG